MKLHTIHTGYFKLDGGAMFGVVPKILWQKTNIADANNLCTWASKSLLIENNEQLILIDCGIGDKQDEKFLSRYHLHGNQTLIKSLNYLGFSTDDITDVILTHLHFDHCGGAVSMKDNILYPTFKNAKYWTNSTHWNWAIHPNDREKASFLKENLLPIEQANQLYFIPEIELFNFNQDINIRFVYGHTKAMMLPEIKLNNQKVIFVSDLIPSTSHIPIPYVPAYDMFPAITLEEKKKFLTEAASNNDILFFQHDAVYECCTVKESSKGIVINETFTLNDFFNKFYRME